MLTLGSVSLSLLLFELFLFSELFRAAKLFLSLWAHLEQGEGLRRLMKLCASHEFRLLCWRPLGPNSRCTLACLLHLRPGIPSPRAWVQTNFSASTFLLVQHLMQFITFQGPSRTPAVSMTSFLCFPQTPIPGSSAYRSSLPLPLPETVLAWALSISLQ